jgi:transcription-repair coupling factor (superfamily II helicase)
MPDTVSIDQIPPGGITTDPAPEGLVAVRLIEWAEAAGKRGLVHIARSGTRAERLARAIRGLAPALAVLMLPPWDCLPYDRAGPSREVMGRRIAALSRLSEPTEAPWLLLTTVDAAMQRLPPPRIWRETSFALGRGDALQLNRLEAFLRRTGYSLQEQVDETGEAAIRGEVVDVFPASSETPFRLDYDNGRVIGIRRYDPATQRTIEEAAELRLGPASEVVLADPAEHFHGIEHWLGVIYDDAVTLFDYAPQAPVVLEPEIDDRRAGLTEQIADAYESRLALRRVEPEHRQRELAAPHRFYLSDHDWQKQLSSRTVITLGGEPAEPAVPKFAEVGDAARAFGRYIEERLAAAGRVALAAGTAADLRLLARTAQHEVERRPESFADWRAALAAAPGTIGTLLAELTSGFVCDDVTVIAFADLTGIRLRQPIEARAAAAPTAGELTLRPGDAVVHVDHGLGILRGLETVGAGGASGEVIKLEYAGDASLLVPIDEIGRIWRYGVGAARLGLDRLDGESWKKRRAEVEQQVAETGRALAALAQARQRAAAPVLEPPRRDYVRFVARFPFAETEDQARAIAATLRDLASGSPMDRLVCGDVGFGKTEVALRAAAAAVFAGKQVAIVAPTTVLVRQHLETFRRRFAGFGVRVEALSRLSPRAAARAVKKGLAEGAVHIVIGTHAVGGKEIRFHNLGLVVVDEEQRFGARQKARLRALGRAIHILTLTATPIPRTMQAAMVGLHEVSVIATPPARRQPIRTFMLPFDPTSVREALRREQRRGGQSFIVCPHIDDIALMAVRLRELVPDLKVMTAHGQMPPAELDEVMMRFADGYGDALLSTNIVENGLDVPAANTMLVWRADRFGIAQLHQLRGRVGRGRVRGVCYLLTDPAVNIAAATERRVRSLESLDRLGAGFTISARDLDLRGAGDLIGDAQAGHIKLLGSELYRDLLQRALAVARGEPPPDENWTPELNFGVHAAIPPAYVPDEEIRLDLYARLARVHRADEIESFAVEIEDRFGPLPEEVSHLLALARLAEACRSLAITKIDAGPQGIALSFRDAASLSAVEMTDERLKRHGERLILEHATAGPEERLQEAQRLLRKLVRRRRQ